jgi:hypothetical protein
VSTENWHEERDRLTKLIEGIEAGTITYVDQKGLRSLQATNVVNVEALKKRLAELNTRLGAN